MPDSNKNNGLEPLLSPDEPPPFYVMHAESEQPILLVCDHASCAFPAVLGDMGLDPFARRCHLAIDIGAGSLTEYLADRLGVTAVLAQYSRLVVDCNRDLMDPSAFLPYGDGILVPGNTNLKQKFRDQRADAIYWPYHAAVSEQVNRLIETGIKPAFISIHSFTPVLNGEVRPWEIGVLWDKDESLREIFLKDFTDEGYLVGDNEPYSGKAPADYTIDNHAEANDLPCLGLEIRQDLINDPAGVTKIGNIMHRIIESIPERIGMPRQRVSA
ncbi:MAG: N-formylglutamate amidohydrolase [Woeseiaceae bacterium]|nr:N-formylglutamate amidohydrolase [Woeseiaceae bacterium]